MARSKLSFVLVFSDAESFDEGTTRFRTVEPRPYINGKPLVPHGYVFNARAILSPGVANADRNLFTCSCGVAGCAGIFDEVAVRVNAEDVTWTFPAEPFAECLHASVSRAAPLRVRFSRQQYAQALQGLTKLLSDAEAHSAIPLALAPCSWHDESDCESLEQDLQDSKSWYEQQQEMAAAREALYGPLLDTEVLLTFPGGHQRTISAATVVFQEACRREDAAGTSFDEEEAAVVAQFRASETALTDTLRALPWADVEPSAWPVDNGCDDPETAQEPDLTAEWPHVRCTVQPRT